MSSFDPLKLVSIKSKKEIRHILNTGKKIYTKYGVFFLAINNNPEKQVAILVKKSIGIAVERNYYKRRIREYIRNNLDTFSDFNQIIFVLNKKLDVSYSGIIKEFQSKIQL